MRLVPGGGASPGPGEGGGDGAPFAPPVAPIRPTILRHPGVVRVDDYHWMNRRDDPAVVAYLEEENRWTDRVMAPLRELEEELFQEMRGRVVEEDRSAPWFFRGYWYYTRFEAGSEYPIHARRKGTMEAPEEIMLREEEWAGDHAYFQVGAWEVSGGGRYLAFAADTVGRRIHDIHIVDLETGQVLVTLPGTTASLAWADDDRTLFYTRADPVTLRSHRVHRHALGSSPALDPLVFEEADEAFSVQVSRTKSWRYVLIGCRQSRSTEYHAVDAADPEQEPRLLIPRRPERLAFPDHLGGHFWIRTDEGGENFRLVRVPEDQPAAEPEEIVPHRPDIFLLDVQLFQDHLVLSERKDGLIQLRVRRWDGSGEHVVAFQEPTYHAALGMNPRVDTRHLRYLYTSLTTPNSVWEYDMETREGVLVKRDDVPGGYDPGDYVTLRLHAVADDGRSIPISLAHRRDQAPGPSPLLLYGYGAYGSSTNPSFSIPRLSLLDRGFVFAIAHVRGGQELGRAWYEEGRMLRKRNSFSDFIRVAEELVARGFTSPDRLYAWGGSAGGLLVGAAMNQRPDLFHGVVAAVPFVDVVTTMLDETIPLTTGEYDEWGNPWDPGFFQAMLEYSPYDNVEAKDYPHLMVTAGFHDSQVQYWEPAKWVARLRALRTDQRMLLLRTHMEAGHGGVSGRFRALREVAFQFAFLLHLAGPRT
jgi:oligopeptidase B